MQFNPYLWLADPNILENVQRIVRVFFININLPYEITEVQNGDSVFWTWQDLCIQGDRDLHDIEPVNSLAQRKRILEPRPLTEDLWKADGF